MKKQDQTPGLIQDLGAIAGLYRDVFRLAGKRIHYGPQWEERAADEALRSLAQEEDREAARARR